MTHDDEKQSIESLATNLTLLNTSPDNKSNLSMQNRNQSVSNNSTSDPIDIIQIPLFVLVVLFAGLYITVVLSRKTLRSNKFNWLTVNVSFASGLFAVIQIVSIAIRLQNIPERIISCRSKGFIINAATCHIMYSHCLTTLCRLLSVQYPHKLLFRSTHWLLGNIILSWIISILVTLPYLFLDGFTCSSSYGKRFLQLYTSVSTILIPVIIFTVCNVCIFRYVRKSSKRVHAIGNNQTNQMSRRDLYLCKIILVTFCVFVFGWTPLFIDQLFLIERNLLPSSVSKLLTIFPPTSLLADVILLIYADQPVRGLILKVVKCDRIIPCWIKTRLKTVLEPLCQ